MAWIEDILRYAPGMDSRVRRLLENGDISWAKAKAICKATLAAPAGQERATLDAALEALRSPGTPKAPRALTFRTAAKRLKGRKEAFRVTGDDLLALLHVLRGSSASAETLERVRAAFPGLLDA